MSLLSGVFSFRASLLPVLERFDVLSEQDGAAMDSSGYCSLVASSMVSMSPDVLGAWMRAAW